MGLSIREISFIDTPIWVRRPSTEVQHYDERVCAMVLAVSSLCGRCVLSEASENRNHYRVVETNQEALIRRVIIASLRILFKTNE
jgi:hypothetical protein